MERTSRITNSASQNPKKRKMSGKALTVIITGIVIGFLFLLLAYHSEQGFWHGVYLAAGSTLLSTSAITVALEYFLVVDIAETSNAILQSSLEDIRDFPKVLERIEGRLEAFRTVGFNRCRTSRQEAIKDFLGYVEEIAESTASSNSNSNLEIDEEDERNGNTRIEKTIDIVSSSARGLIGYLDRRPSDIQIQWRELIIKNPTLFRFLLTHPAHAHLRQPAEERGSGDIEMEILKTAVFLHAKAKMDSRNLRLYRGSPSVFAIQADTHILLNPYPYGQMAMETLCLEFESNKNGSPIEEFMTKHFRHTWEFYEQASKQVNRSPLVVGINGFKDIIAAFMECTFLGNNNRLRLTAEQVEELDDFTKAVMMEVSSSLDEDDNNKAIDQEERDLRIQAKGGKLFSSLLGKGLTYAPTEGRFIDGCPRNNNTNIEDTDS